MAKAEQGQLRFRLPVGLIYEPVGQIVLDPDEAVAEAVHLVFSLFEQFGSALAVVTHFAEHQVRFPTRWWGGKQADELIWSHLTHERVLNILHSPLYAGAYVYGRTQFRRRVLPGEEPRVKGRTRRVKQLLWPTDAYSLSTAGIAVGLRVQSGSYATGHENLPDDAGRSHR